MFKLDKTVFKAGTLNDASNQKEFFHTKTTEERFAIAVYLIKTSFRINEFPPMEKKLFYVGKLSDR